MEVQQLAAPPGLHALQHTMASKAFLLYAVHENLKGTDCVQMATVELAAQRPDECVEVRVRLTGELGPVVNSQPVEREERNAHCKQ